MTENLQEAVAQVVARVVLESSGRVLRPDDEAPLFEHTLEEVDLARLVMALHERFDVHIDVGEANPRVLGSIAKIAQLIAARPHRA